MSERSGKDIESKISPEIFNDAVRELVRLSRRGEPLTQGENQGSFDYEEFLELDPEEIVGRQSNQKTPYGGMTLDVDVIIYGEATNTLKGNHAIAYLFVTLINEEYEFLISTKYRFHVNGSVIKAHTTGSESFFTAEDIETTKKLMLETGINLEELEKDSNGDEEIEMKTDELKKLSSLLSKVPS